MDPNIIGLEQELVNPLASLDGDTYPNGFWKIMEYRNLVNDDGIEILLNSYVNYDAYLQEKERVSAHNFTVTISEEYVIEDQPGIRSILYMALIAQDPFFVDATTFDTDDALLHVPDEPDVPDEPV